MEQTEQDFREIERERDLPPDEPYRGAIHACEECGGGDLFGRVRDGLHYIVCGDCDHEWSNDG